MLNSLKKRQDSVVMVRLFILMNLLFPLFGSNVGSAYSPDIVYANVFVVMFVGLAWLEGNIDWKRKSWLVWFIGLCLVGFNVFAFYVNKTYYGWYAGQLNVTIAFIFIIAWLLMKEDAACMDEDMVKFLLYAAAITNAIGLIPGLTGTQTVWVSDAGYSFDPQVEWDTSYTWIYLHKSEYSFMLVLFLALTVVYRRLYDQKWQFWGSIAIYAIGLWIADTRATMLAAMFIPAGVLMDYLLKKAGGFKWKYLLYFIPFVIIGLLLLYKFSKERDVWSLGLRTYIWKGAVEFILENPWGRSAMTGLQTFPVEGGGNSWEAWNCHNVFLNYFLQFSIPAGFFYFLMTGSLIVTAIKKNFSFQTLGIWVALLIPMNMDWCVLLAQVPMMLLMWYFLFFAPLKNRTA